MTIVSLSARYESATVSEFIEHHSPDVSSTGIFIKTASAIPIGTLIEFEVQIAGRRTIITGVGRVVWTRDAAHAAAERPAGIGIRFIELDESSKALIGKLVAARPDAGGRYEEEAKAAAGATPPPPTAAAPAKVRPSLRPSASPSRAPPRPGPPRGARRALPPVVAPPRRTTSPPEPPPAPSSSPDTNVEAEAEEDMTLYEPMPPMRKGRKATLVGLGAPLPAVTPPPRRVSLPAPAHPAPSAPSAPSAPPGAPEAAALPVEEAEVEEESGTEAEAMTIVGAVPSPEAEAMTIVGAEPSPGPPEPTLLDGAPEAVPEIVPASLVAVAQATPSAVAGGGRIPAPARGRARVIVMASAALVATVGLVLLATRPRAAPAGSLPIPAAVPSAVVAAPEPVVPAPTPVATAAQSDDDVKVVSAEDLPSAPLPGAPTAAHHAAAAAVAPPTAPPAATQDVALPRPEPPRPPSTPAPTAETPAPVAVVRPRAAPSASAAREATTAPATAPAAPKPATDCTPPYSLDAEGNKHFKAECFMR